MKIYRVLLLFTLVILFAGPNLAINITDCADLDQPGETYLLTEDIINSSASHCMNISANNVTLDCQGHTIDGIDSASTYGIYIYRFPETNVNITVKNCRVSDWYYGFSISYVDNISIINCTSNSNSYRGFEIYSCKSSTFINLTANLNGWVGFHFQEFLSNNLNDITANFNDNIGIYLDSSSSNNIFTDITANFNKYEDGIRLSSSNSNTFSNITANSNSNYGVRIYYNSDNNTIANSTISNNSLAGLYLDESGSDDPENNKIYNCLFNNSVNIKIDDGIAGENYFNTTKQLGTNIYTNYYTYIGGNYYTNSTGNGYSDNCTDSDKDGFCDNPLNLSNGTSVAWDYLPLSDESIQNITISLNLSDSIVNPEQNLTISGQALLLPDNTPVSNNSISIWLVMIFSACSVSPFAL